MQELLLAAQRDCSDYYQPSVVGRIMAIKGVAFKHHVPF